jgi:hypothetical protein
MKNINIELPSRTISISEIESYEFELDIDSNGDVEDGEAVSNPIITGHRLELQMKDGQLIKIDGDKAYDICKTLEENAPELAK